MYAVGRLFEEYTAVAWEVILNLIFKFKYNA